MTQLSETDLSAARRSKRVPFYGWAIVAVGVLVTFCSGPGQSYVFSVFVDPMLGDTGISRTRLSALYAIGTGASAVMVAVVGRLVDRLGARVMLGAIAVALGAACFLMASATGSLSLLLGFAALRALGQGSLPVTATLLTAQWFVRKRGRAMAIVGLGFAASNALLPPLARFLIDTVGWRGAYVVLGIMVWVLIIPAALFIVRDRPEEMGLGPDGVAIQEEPEDQVSQRARSNAARRVFSSLDFWTLAIPLTTVPFIVTTLVFHQTSILAERGLGPSVAAGIFVPFAVAVAGGNALAGLLVERLGPRRPLILTQALLLAALIELHLVSGPVAAVAYAATLGASTGMTGVLAGVTWAHYYGREGLGRLQGSASMVMISAAALAPLPLAALQQLSGGYTTGILTMSVLPLLSIALIALFTPKVTMTTRDSTG